MIARFAQLAILVVLAVAIWRLLRSRRP